MNSLFDRYNLNAFERRLIGGVLLGVFFVVNLMLVGPKFREWGEVRAQQESAQQKIRVYQAVLNKRDDLEERLEKLENSGMKVLPKERASKLFELIQQKLRDNKLPATGLQHNQNRPSSRAGNLRKPKEEFFEQDTYSLNLNANYKQLIDFLKAIGSDENLMIRVGRLHLTSAGHQLNCRITLVANYQPQPSGNSSVSWKR